MHARTQILSGSILSGVCEEIIKELDKLKKATCSCSTRSLWIWRWWNDEITGTTTCKINGIFQRFLTTICTFLPLELRRSDSYLFRKSQCHGFGLWSHSGNDGNDRLEHTCWINNSLSIDIYQIISVGVRYESTPQSSILNIHFKFSNKALTSKQQHQGINTHQTRMTAGSKESIKCTKIRQTDSSHCRILNGVLGHGHGHGIFILATYPW
jgi:hypothetical protein